MTEIVAGEVAYHFLPRAGIGRHAGSLSLFFGPGRERTRLGGRFADGGAGAGGDG